MGTAEDNRDAVAAYTEQVWNRGDVDAGAHIYDPDVVVHGAPPGSPPGVAGVLGLVRMFRAALPDIHVTNEDLIAVGDRVVQRWRVRGTQQGPLMDIPPTGRAVDVEGINIFRMTDGKIVERWGLFDMQGLRAQLGGPAPGARPGA